MLMLIFNIFGGVAPDAIWEDVTAPPPPKPHH